MRLLLIEDDPEVARFVVKGLRESGHTVEHAAEGREGLFRATEGEYDVIVTNRMLPHVDGLAMVQLLRQQSRLFTARVLAGEVDNVILIELDALADESTSVSLERALLDIDTLQRTLATLLQIAQAESRAPLSDAGRVNLGELAQEIAALYEPAARDQMSRGCGWASVFQGERLAEGFVTASRSRIEPRKPALDDIDREAESQRGFVRIGNQ